MEKPPPSSTTATATSKKFTSASDDAAYKTHHYRVYSTTVYLIRPPNFPTTTALPWITTREIPFHRYSFTFRHPLTSAPHPFTLPNFFYLSDLNPDPLSTSYHFEPSYPVDKLLVLPVPRSSPDYDCSVVNTSGLFALYAGGLLRAFPKFNRADYKLGFSPWVDLSYGHGGGGRFDDIVRTSGNVYVIDRAGFTKSINHHTNVRKIKLGKTLTTEPVIPGNSGRFGWRKRFAVDDRGSLYLVVRTEERFLRVFRKSNEEKGAFWTEVFRKSNEEKGGFWKEVRGFEGNQNLFMGRDHCFFLRASRKFPGKEYKNCIVFSEAAFPQYGNDCWEFTQIDDNRQFGEDDIAVFRLSDGVFARDGENSAFPKLDWSPPAWAFNAASLPDHQFRSERDPEEYESSDSETGATNWREILMGTVCREESTLMVSNSKDVPRQEEMETNFVGQGHDQDGMESDSDSQIEGGIMECDLTSLERESVELDVDAIAEGSASLHDSGTTVTQAPISATEKETTEEETSRSESVLRACTSSTVERNGSDSGTAEFKGYDIRPDLVSTLQKIWEKHGNILENCVVRSGDIISRSLESLATMVRILDDSTVQSMSDTQADYLVSTLSDLRYIGFKVEWLIPFVEKAEKLHKVKPLVQSLNNFSELSSQVKERKAILLGEVAILNEEENRLKEVMAKVSNKIPFCGQVKFDEPLGSGT